MSVLKLCMIGCGNMGTALLNGWRKALPQHGFQPQVTIVKPTRNGLPEGSDIRYLSDLSAIKGETFDVIIWAVKPQVLPEVLGQWQGVGGLHLSVIAGRKLEYFRAALGDVAVIRTVPNTPSTVGMGMTALFAHATTTVEQRQLAELLLKAVGKTVWLDSEEQMDAFTGLAGSGPAYIFYLLECLREAGLAVGLPEGVAKEAALQTVAGAAQLALNGEAPAELRRKVTSPNGTTAAGLNVLMDAKTGLEPLVKATVTAATKRSKELAG